MTLFNKENLEPACKNHFQKEYEHGLFKFQNMESGTLNSRKKPLGQREICPEAGFFMNVDDTELFGVPYNVCPDPVPTT